MSVVYQHIRKDNGKLFYIGIGKTKKRAYEKEGRNLFWNRIVNYVGYYIEIIHTSVTWEDACKLEKFYIHKYGRKDLGTGILCNLTDGGDGNVNWTPSLRIAQSERMKGKPAPNKGIPATLEHRQKTSKTRIERGVSKGEKNPMYGKTGELSPNYGKKRPEHSLALKGRPKPEGFSEKCRLNKQGEKNASSKLKEDDVRYIRLVYKRGDKEFGGTPLSIKYGVSVGLITDIAKYKRWKHIN
jgi:hypothetical protein